VCRTDEQTILQWATARGAKVRPACRHPRCVWCRGWIPTPNLSASCIHLYSWAATKLTGEAGMRLRTSKPVPPSCGCHSHCVLRRRRKVKGSRRWTPAGMAVQVVSRSILQRCNGAHPSFPFRRPPPPLFLLLRFW
jgi:hypothetical protein